MRLVKSIEGHLIAVWVPWDGKDRKKMFSVVAKHKIDWWLGSDEDDWDDVKICFSQSIPSNYQYRPNSLNHKHGESACVGIIVDTKKILQEIIE